MLATAEARGALSAAVLAEDSVPTAAQAVADSVGWFAMWLQRWLTVSTGGSDRLGGYAVREELPLPSKPPYTAHLGNLSFDATEGDINDFFADCEVTNVRIVEDKLERKPKGFGYVEFGSLDGLKKALDLSGTQFQGRNIRVSVAEPRTSEVPDVADCMLTSCSQGPP